MWRAIHWLCATKSVTTDVWGGVRRPSATSADIAVAGVAWTVTTASGRGESSNGASRRAPRRGTPRANGEALALQSPSAETKPPSTRGRRGIAGEGAREGRPEGRENSARKGA